MNQHREVGEQFTFSRYSIHAAHRAEPEDKQRDRVYTPYCDKYLGRRSEEHRLKSPHEPEPVTSKGKVNRFCVLHERGTDTCHDGAC